MKYANFSDRISKLILTMISNLKGSVIINYTKTDEFEMKIGVIQGSPLSSLLFILAIEPVICTALNQGGLGGFKFFDATIPLCGFADDLFIITTIQFLPNWLNLLETFGRVSGEKLNLNCCYVQIRASALRLASLKRPYNKDEHLLATTKASSLEITVSSMI